MTSDLHYAQVSVDLPAAVRHCAAVGLPHTALRDEGAVVKTVLTEGLAQAPRPWSIIAQHAGTATLIGYSAGMPEKRAMVMPTLGAAITSVDSVPVPEIAEGTPVTLTGRIVPTIRVTGRGERDAFLCQDGDDRSTVYRHYVGERLHGVDIEAFDLKSFGIETVARKSRATWRAMRVPVATIAMRGRVSDGGNFQQALASGIGRQKAFGFGCLRVAL